MTAPRMNPAPDPKTIPGPRVKSLLATARARRILVVGDVMLDQFLWGHVARISPQAPVPVVDFDRESFMPGGAACKPTTRSSDIVRCTSAKVRAAPGVRVVATSAIQASKSADATTAPALCGSEFGLRDACWGVVGSVAPART